MDEEPTCGKGLAEHSALPAKMGELIATLAENLELHMRALDLTDESARQEHDAYQDLATSYRRIAADLQATAARMAGYRDLPMGRHDEEAMSGPQVGEAFAGFVSRAQELLELLQRRVEQDREMLAEMGGGGTG